MTPPVFDSNILIDVTRGHDQATEELKKYPDIAISITSWIEVMSGAKTAEEEKRLETFLSIFSIIHIDLPLAHLASRLRRQFRLKLPDAVIWATAQSRNTILVTRNSKDFPQGHPSIRVPYVL